MSLILAVSSAFFEISKNQLAAVLPFLGVGIILLGKKDK
jgi:hypothetical protein